MSYAFAHEAAQEDGQRHTHPIMSGQRAPPRPSQSPHATYNPQDYASPNSSSYSPQQYSPHVASPSHQSRDQFQPYNPAVYRDSSIANAANQLYGNASPGGYAPAAPANYSPYQHQYSPSAPLPPPPQQFQQQQQSSYSPRGSSLVNSPDATAHRPRFSSYASPYQSPYQSPAPGTAYSTDPPYPPQHGIPTPPQNFPAPPAPPQHSSPSPDFLHDGAQAYGSHGRGGSEGLNITSAFPRPPVTDSAPTTLPHRSSTSRPLPGVPQQSETFFDDGSGLPDSKTDNDQLQQDLFDQVETALNFGLGPSSRNNSNAGQRTDSLQQSHGTYYDEYGEEDSDAEAAAGLEAMRKAEQHEQEQLRRQTTATQQNGQAQTTQDEEQDFEDEDYGNVDMSALGGGFGFDMPFGTTRPSQNLTATQEILQNGLNTHPSVSSRGTATSDRSENTLHTDTQTSMTSITTANTGASARVDASGTGGLSDPMPPRRQMSFDADDIAERQYLNNGDNYPIPETFYPPPHQPGPRPLPPPPVEVGQPVSNRDQPYLAPQSGTQRYQGQVYNGQYDPALLPRSHSLGNHSTAPATTAPARAKTDAEERKRLTGIRSPPDAHSGVGVYDSAENLDLPPLPAGRRLQPSKLQASQFERCREPWALSSVTTWLRDLAEGDSELRRAPVEEALVNLFMFKVPTLNIAVAESLSVVAVNEMLAVDSLILEEEWLRFGPETPSGVLFQLTNKGCYSQISHERATSGRCYSHHCQRTERKLAISEDKASENSAEWAVFWKLSKEDIEASGKTKKEVELQNNLHEIISAEYKFLRDLNVLRALYRDGLQQKKDVMSPRTVETFVKNVFGRLDALQKANEEYLLPQLKYRQQEQGPWVLGFSDIFRDWIRKAKTAYIEYTANFPSAEFLVRQEDRKNLLFHTYLDEMRNHPSANRLDIWHYLKVPITKIQRYSLLLSTVYKNMKTESEEKANLAIAINEIQEATRECNARLAEESKKVDLLDLQAKLQLRPEMKHVELNLTQWGRELIHTGDLQRTGRGRFTWLDTHAILLDNYLVLAKVTADRDTKANVYDVSKMPIPMDLLMLESADDDPIVKSTMKGIAVGTATTKATVTAPDPRIIRQNSSLPGKPGSPMPGATLTQSQTTGAQPTMVTATALEPAVSQENTLYPFRVRHLGKEVYTLFAATSGARKEWADKIIEAKTRHAASLFAQNAEPFRLRVIADTAFTLDQAVPSQKGVTIKGTPLHRAIEEVERTYASSGRPAPVCRARVNCATTFKQPDGRQMTAIGTDYGLYLSEADNPRGWTRVRSALPLACD